MKINNFRGEMKINNFRGKIKNMGENEMHQRGNAFEKKCTALSTPKNNTKPQGKLWWLLNGETFRAHFWANRVPRPLTHSHIKKSLI